MKHKPLRSAVIVKPLPQEEKVKGGIIIPDTIANPLSLGIVIAKGVGCMEIKEDDKVLYGGSFMPIEFDGEAYLLMEEVNIKVVL